MSGPGTQLSHMTDGEKKSTIKEHFRALLLDFNHNPLTAQGFADFRRKVLKTFIEASDFGIEGWDSHGALFRLTFRSGTAFIQLRSKDNITVGY